MRKHQIQRTAGSTQGDKEHKERDIYHQEIY